MRCPNCQTINPPHAKFCLECGNRLVVCPNCGTINVPAAKFCIECGTPLVSRTGNSAAASLIDSNNTSGNNRRTQPLPDVLEPPEERRVVTIMFADITGSTPLADHLDPEEMRAILSSYFNLMTEQIRRHGGTVEKYIGDAVMAVFGLPSAHEDDPDRAIRATLDMQRALARFNALRKARDPHVVPLQMRIGITTGEVAAPGNSHFSRRDFLITGDAVNVAARLQQVAMPDTILIGERTYLAAREVFKFQAMAPLRLKGKPEPIKAWVVQGPQDHTRAIAQHPRGIEGLETPLIGRALELTLMHATYARVQAEQHPHLITLLGPPGIGKSRLVREFIEREEETSKCTTCEDRLTAPLVLRGRCPPYGEGITYWPLIETLRTLLHAKDEESPEDLDRRFTEFVRDTLSIAKRSEDPVEVTSAIARSIGRGLSGQIGEQESPKRERERQRATHGKSPDQGAAQATLLRAWRILLESLAQQQPLILVIDDLQWADEALLDLLEHLMERITSVPILLICPARPDFFERRRDWGGGRRNFTTIALEALSQEDTGELINALLKGSDLPETLRHTIQSRAEGNPFFVEEIVRMLIDQGVLVYNDDCWHVRYRNGALLSELATPAAPPDDTLLDLHYVLPLPRVPDTIQGVLTARVDLLNPVEKRVLQQASIIGRTFWLAGLLELTSELELDTITNTLEALMDRDFIVETRQQARSPVDDDRIFSFKHILIRDVVYNNLSRVRRCQEHARLALWLEEKTAGHTENFAELLAYHYQQALATWPSGLAASAIHIDDMHDQDTGSSTEPLQLTRTEVRRRAITHLTIAGDQALHSYYTIRAIQAYGEVLDMLDESNADKVTLARMHEKLGDAYTQRANTNDAWNEYRQALQIVKAEPQADSNELLHLYDRLAELATRWFSLFRPLPDMQEVRSYIDAGLKLSENRPASADRAAFLTYLAMWYLHQGTHDNAGITGLALQSGLEARRIAEEADDAGVLWVALDALGVIYTCQHKYQDSHKAQHDRQKLAQRISSREELHDLYYSLGQAHEYISDYPSAAKWLGESWRIAQTMESPSLLLISMLGRMYVWYEWNRWGDAREVAQSILQLIDQYQLEEHWQLKVCEQLALIAYRTGQEEEGDGFIRQYKRISSKIGAASPPLPMISLAREDWTHAAAEIRESLKQEEPFPSPIMLAHLAELSVTTGEDAATQQALCERAVVLAKDAGARKYLGVALRARGYMYLEQENWGAAEADLQEALHCFKELDLPWERGQTFYCLGLLYRRRADTLQQDNSKAREEDIGRAQYHFDKALGFFESLNAVPDAERVRLALRQDRTTPV
ncbi:MAG: AAA family ATPase [Chloroflexota bacterium]|nr:AAA family ATPase [Chloroflexota bacterium]